MLEVPSGTGNTGCWVLTYEHKTLPPPPLPPSMDFRTRKGQQIPERRPVTPVGSEGLPQAWAWAGGKGGETPVPGKVLRAHPHP